MVIGIPCPKCKSKDIRATRKPHKMITERLALRLWECANCNDRFIIASVVVKDETADKLEAIYEQKSTEGIH